MARLLVTGGAGFLGVNFVRHVLATTDHHVTVVDALTYAGNRASLDGLPDARLTFVHADIADALLIDALVRDADAVVHFAAETHNDHALAEPAPFVRTNLVGTFTLLEAVRAHGVRFHQVSTDEVYGDLALDSSDRFREGDPFDPSSPYSATKAGADLLVRAWVRSYGLRATVSHCSNSYGPYQHVEKFIPRQITQVLRGARPRLYGSGDHIRDWIHAEDHSAAVLAILERGTVGETYLIGADSARSNLAVVASILELMGQPAAAYDHVTDRVGHDRRYALDSTKLRTELGWEPEHRDFEAGLAATIAWYRENEDWWAPAKDATEAFYAARGQ